MAGNRVEISPDLIQQYVNITGSDEDSALHLLEAFGGDLESAVNMYLEGESASKTNQASTSAGKFKTNFQKKTVVENDETIVVDDEPGSSRTTLNREIIPLDDDDEDDVRAPIPQKQAILVEDAYHALPYRHPQRRTSARNVFDGCRDFRKETEEQEKMLREGHRSDTSNNKKRRLHELFRPPVDILHDGNFLSARDQCTSTCKWLLVNLQNTMEFACQVLNRDVWSNKVVRELLKENFVLWQVSHNSDEGLHYSTFYPVKNHPHLAVIDPRTGERLIVWENLGVKPSANQFAELVTFFLSENPVFTDELNTSTDQHVDMKVTAPDIDSPTSSSIIDKSEDKQLEAAIQASLKMLTPRGVISIDEDEETEEEDSEINISDEEVEVVQQQTNGNVSPSKKRKIDITTTYAGKQKEMSNTNTSYAVRTDVKTTSESLSVNTKPTNHVTEDNIIPPEEAVKILLRTPTNERKQLIISHNSTLQIIILNKPTHMDELTTVFNLDGSKVLATFTGEKLRTYDLKTLITNRLGIPKEFQILYDHSSRHRVFATNIKRIKDIRLGIRSKKLLDPHMDYLNIMQRQHHCNASYDHVYILNSKGKTNSPVVKFNMQLQATVDHLKLFLETELGVPTQSQLLFECKDHDSFCGEVAADQNLISLLHKHTLLPEQFNLYLIVTEKPLNQRFSNRLSRIKPMSVRSRLSNGEIVVVEEISPTQRIFTLSALRKHIQKLFFIPEKLHHFTRNSAVLETENLLDEMLSDRNAKVFIVFLSILSTSNKMILRGCKQYNIRCLNPLDVCRPDGRLIKTYYLENGTKTVDVLADVSRYLHIPFNLLLLYHLENSNDKYYKLHVSTELISGKLEQVPERLVLLVKGNSSRVEELCMELDITVAKPVVIVKSLNEERGFGSYHINPEKRNTWLQNVKIQIQAKHGIPMDNQVLCYRSRPSMQMVRCERQAFSADFFWEDKLHVDGTMDEGVEIFLTPSVIGQLTPIFSGLRHFKTLIIRFLTSEISVDFLTNKLFTIKDVKKYVFEVRGIPTNIQKVVFKKSCVVKDEEELIDLYIRQQYTDTDALTLSVLVEAVKEIGIYFSCPYRSVFGLPEKSDSDSADMVVMKTDSVAVIKRKLQGLCTSGPLSMVALYHSVEQRESLTDSQKVFDLVEGENTWLTLHLYKLVQVEIYYEGGGSGSGGYQKKRSGVSKKFELRIENEDETVEELKERLLFSVEEFGMVGEDDNDESRYEIQVRKDNVFDIDNETLLLDVEFCLRYDLVYHKSCSIM